MLRTLTRAESSATAFAVAVALAYGVLPLVVNYEFVPNPYLAALAVLAAIGAAGILLGSRLPLLDGMLTVRRIRMGLDTFLALIWFLFAVLVIVACITADKIPAVAALQGVDPETLATLREKFLKARTGWESGLVYANALLAGTLIPYSLSLALLHRHRLRWVLFWSFTVYCLLFVEKAFFLRAAIPLAYLVIQGKVASRIRPTHIVAGAVAVLVTLTVISGAAERSDGPDDTDFFSTSFTSTGPLAFLVWRGIAIPIVTAADTLRVFEEQYDGALLWGASSSLFASLRGVDRVNVEQAVFAAQWGQTDTETGSANSIYLTEAYLNFGYAGCLVFSVLVGLILRLFARSKDEALRSLWMFFCFGLFVSPLTATLLSAGFLPLLLLSLVVEAGGAGGYRAMDTAARGLALGPGQGPGPMPLT